MSNITLTIPNDDHIALRAFGKALEEMALAHGAEPRKTIGELSYKLNVDTSKATAALERLNNVITEHPHVEVDTTAQQVESLAALDNDSPIITVNPTCHALSNEELQERGFDSTGTPWDERIHSASKALNADGTWRLRRKPKDMDELEWSDYVSMIKADLQYPVECGGEKEESAGGNSEFVVDPYDTYEEGELPPVVAVEPPVTPPGDDFHTDADVVTEQTIAGIPPLPVPPPTDDWQSEVTHPETGDLCSVCMKPQFSSPSGVTCENGHGGAPAYEKPVPPPVVVAPEVTTWDFPRLMTFLTERHGKIDVATVNTLLAQDGMSSVQELNAHPDKIGPFVARVKAHLGE